MCFSADRGLHSSKFKVGIYEKSSSYETTQN